MHVVRRSRFAVHRPPRCLSTRQARTISPPASIVPSRISTQIGRPVCEWPGSGMSCDSNSTSIEINRCRPHRNESARSWRPFPVEHAPQVPDVCASPHVPCSFLETTGYTRESLEHSDIGKKSKVSSDGKPHMAYLAALVPARHRVFIHLAYTYANA